MQSKEKQMTLTGFQMNRHNHRGEKGNGGGKIHLSCLWTLFFDFASVQWQKELQTNTEPWSVGLLSHNDLVLAFWNYFSVLYDSAIKYFVESKNQVSHCPRREL